jgi:lipoprotein Spr
MVSWKSSAQIITSKKEAQKKGVYSYTDNQSTTASATSQKPAATIDKTAVAKELATLSEQRDVLAYEPVVAKEIKKGGPNKIEAPAPKVNPVKKGVKYVLNDKEDPDFTPSPPESYYAEQVVNNAMQFEGVRYRGGGTTKDGMDCSGMVYATFQIFDVTLPRSSHEMAKVGTEIKLSEVKKGDLLFFRNNKRRNIINHVGLVTEVTPEGEVKFIHSSTSSGVIVSSMNEPYNERTFVKASRVIED